MKKFLSIILILIVIGGGAFAFTKFRSQQPQTTDKTTKKKRIEEPTNVISVEKRPYIQIIPHTDGHNVSIKVSELKKDANSVDYELEYQAGSLLQGAFGQFELASLPATEKILLGSCSAGGACTYHENVQGGSLLTRFSGSQPYALKSRWKYIDNTDKNTTFASQDAKFQLESQDLKNNRYVIIFNTAGFPEGLENSPISEIYSLTSSNKLSGSAELSIRAAEEGQLTIMGYDGSMWHKFATTMDGKVAKATVKLMELYTVIKY